jgi:hypothetical protein
LQAHSQIKSFRSSAKTIPGAVMSRRRLCEMRCQAMRTFVKCGWPARRKNESFQLLQLFELAYSIRALGANPSGRLASTWASVRARPAMGTLSSSIAKPADQPASQLACCSNHESISAASNGTTAFQLEACCKHLLASERAHRDEVAAAAVASGVGGGAL